MRRALLVIVFAAAATAHADRARHHAPRTRLDFDPKTVYKVPRGASPAEGPADAPITIVDWSDYACGYCNRAQPTLDRLARLYPGQLRWVHRWLPLDDDNLIAAEAALAAAAQGKLRPMHERLYGAYGHVDRADVELIAQQLGLDMIRFRAELDAGTYRAQIVADAADARALGVSGTPAFFINGRPIHGNRQLKTFVDIVDEELLRASTMRAAHPVDLYEALTASGKVAADTASDPADEPGDLVPSKLYKVCRATRAAPTTRSSRSSCGATSSVRTASARRRCSRTSAASTEPTCASCTAISPCSFTTSRTSPPRPARPRPTRANSGTFMTGCSRARTRPSTSRARTSRRSRRTPASISRDSAPRSTIDAFTTR
jgi:protein-disulfide isomerase